jgi:rod shape determining protein RodA
MNRSNNIFSTIDWLSVVLYFVLVIFGWMNIFAVNYNHGNIDFFNIHNRYTLQALWIFICSLIIIVLFVLDGRIYSFLAYPAYGFGLLMLLSVLVFGTTINNSKSWIVFGPVSLQPAEFAKTATILALAKFLSSFNVKITRRKDILITIGIVALPTLLIMAQPDFGSTLVYGIILLVLYREGLPGWVLILLVSIAILFLLTLLLSPIVLLIVLASLAIGAFGLINRRKTIFAIAILSAGIFITGFFLIDYYGLIKLSDYQVIIFSLIALVIVGVVFTFSNKVRGVYVIILGLILTIGFTYSVDFVFHNIMKEHQRNRVNVMLGLESDPYGYEYNVRQSKIAIGSGGFAGKGFMQGTQTKFKFVPEQSTDFIFCTVGEEWGFLGSFGLILAYIGLLIRLIFLAERQRSKFSRIYGYGVLSILFFHFAVNIGMTIGLFPVIGIPLPFVSYGGSSLLAFTILLFIFLKLDSGRKGYLL